MLCGETGFLKTIDVANTASDFSVSDYGASDFSGSGGGVSADFVLDTPGGRRECVAKYLDHLRTQGLIS